MEEDDEIQAQTSKFPRVGNGIRNDSNNIGPRRGGQQNPDEELEDGDVRRRGHQGGSDGGSTNRFHTWHHSSRIIRVSRASGGKDRHSKVMTSKGLRDRRVRLSVATAIQFYDLQDRLGYDQPSKAVEWLIKSAADAIAELPSLFPDTPKQPSDEKRASEQGFDSADAELDAETSYHHQQHQNNNQSQNLSLSKSACSSTSETSKGSGLSLSRSDMRVKARERARERTAKEKEKESESHNNNNNSNIAHHVNPISQPASFTELLTGGISSTVPATTSPTGSVHQNHHHHHQGGGDEHNNSNNLFNKATRNNWDYFSSGLLGPSSSSRTHQHNHNHNQSSSGFSQIQLGHSSIPEAMTVSAFNTSSSSPSDQLQMQHHFSFIQDHLMQPVVTSSSQPSGSDYNLNFTISSSGLAGYNNNRGTLQSNSPSHILPHLQRFSSPIDASTVPFFIGAAPAPASAAVSSAATMESSHHHPQLQFSPVFDGRLQLYYSDESRHTDHKGKAKN